MIVLSEKKDCCGCTACVAACPVKCISMHTDEEGFSYASTNKDLCIDCHLCERVCPEFCRGKQRHIPIETFAAKNRNSTTQLSSSSGGIFPLLAQRTLQRGGKVYGASYDSQWQVRHIAITSVEELPRLMGSKYMQSHMGDCMAEVKSDLEAGREVLFSGTPCQVAGLKRLLRKRYDNLLTIEIVCHGVPSPKVWQEYIKSINPRQLRVQQVNMRDKSTGWQRYSITIKGEEGKTLVSERASHNIYMQGFLAGMFTRPSCFDCPTKGGRSGCDITLGDFWGVRHVVADMFDKRGVSLVMVHTEHGAEALRHIDMERKDAPYKGALRYNPSIEHSSRESELRHKFWPRFHEVGISAIVELLPARENVLLRLIKRLFHLITR